MLLSSDGSIDLYDGDYVYIPKGTTFILEYSGDAEILFMETYDRIDLPGHNVTGGHLFDATVNPLLEIEILKLNSVHINRELNSRSGLKEMKVS